MMKKISDTHGIAFVGRRQRSARHRTVSGTNLRHRLRRRRRPGSRLVGGAGLGEGFSGDEARLAWRLFSPVLKDSAVTGSSG